MFIIKVLGICLILHTYVRCIFLPSAGSKEISHNISQLILIGSKYINKIILYAATVSRWNVIKVHNILEEITSFRSLKLQIIDRKEVNYING